MRRSKSLLMYGAVVAAVVALVTGTAWIGDHSKKIAAPAAPADATPYEVTYVPEGYRLGRTVETDFPATQGKNYLVVLEPETPGPPITISMTTGLTPDTTEPGERVDVRGHSALASEDVGPAGRSVQHLVWVDDRRVGVLVNVPGGTDRSTARRIAVDVARGLRARNR